MSRKRNPSSKAASLRGLACGAGAMVALGAVASSAVATDVYLSSGASIYRMDTTSMASSPVLVKANAFVPPAFQGLAARCGSLFAMSMSKIMRVDPATGAITDVATDLGTGSASGLVISADGTRLWWATDAGNIYTRLVSDPVASAPTAIVSGASLGGVPLLARVGDTLLVRSTTSKPQAASTLPAATTTTTLTPLADVETSTNVFIGANETQAFYETNASGWTIGSIDLSSAAPVVDNLFGTVPANFTPGVIMANAEKVWAFDAVGARIAEWSISATPRTGSIINTALPGIVNGAVVDGCGAPAPSPAPAPTPVPTPTPVATTLATPTVNTSAPGKNAVVTVRTQLGPKGKYTFIFEKPSANEMSREQATSSRVAMQKGTRLGNRRLKKAYTAAVITTTADNAKVVTRALLRKAQAKKLNLRVVYAPTGTAQRDSVIKIR